MNNKITVAKSFAPICLLLALILLMALFGIVFAMIHWSLSVMYATAVVLLLISLEIWTEK